MIIDAHVHFGSILNFEMTQEMVLTAMNRYNIHAMLVSNSQAAECDHNQVELPESLQISQRKTVEDSISFAKENKGKIYAALWCKPKLEGPSDWLEQQIKENLDVVKALKFHPYHSATAFNDQKIQDYFYLAEKYNLPVITHCGSGEHDNADLVFQMAQKFPAIKFVMAHLGLGTDNNHAIDLCASLPNLYGDTAWVPIESAVNFIHKCGSQKLFFGSDTPIDGVDTYRYNGYGQRSLYQDYFNILQDRISSQDYENIMWRNAAETYGIK